MLCQKQVHVHQGTVLYTDTKYARLSECSVPASGGKILYAICTQQNVN